MIPIHYWHVAVQQNDVVVAVTLEFLDDRLAVSEYLGNVAQSFDDAGDDDLVDRVVFSDEYFQRWTLVEGNRLMLNLDMDGFGDRGRKCAETLVVVLRGTEKRDEFIE